MDRSSVQSHARPFNDNAKTNEELKVVLGCSLDKWYYGEDARYLPNVVTLETPKLTAMGLPLALGGGSGPGAPLNQPSPSPAGNPEVQ
ncbi:hypothetical protein N7449_009671 [Penicillium cf. viridicatum]|uniref:Uncharacterized protein n=1 Tax=Penicillium cf. viridicatum TaxID=2972119 RepID=A0A9W9JAI8_9EURO|nr:hypothetical protein N7449_009671 [Penicillium cf. viridicatum]